MGSRFTYFTGVDMRLYVRGENIETAPYSVYPHPTNSADEPRFEMTCQVCTVDVNEPYIVWHGSMASFGVLMGAVIRHEQASEKHSSELR